MTPAVTRLLTLVVHPGHRVGLVIRHRSAEEVYVGARLKAIVDEVKAGSSGLVNVDLARLNLRVGKAISRLAESLPDDDELVLKARKVADEILGKVGR